MKRHSTWVRTFAVMLGGLVIAACGDDAGTLYDLTVIETVPVEFGAMDGGAPEAAVVPLADLTSEPAYVEARESLRCVGVDLAESAIVVDALDVGQFATPFIYTVSAGSRGAANYRTLATFSGPIAEGQRIRFSDTSFQVDPAGVAFVEETLLGDTPALDLEVRGEVPGRIDDLVVTLTLTLKFSSTAGDCP